MDNPNNEASDPEAIAAFAQRCILEYKSANEEMKAFMDYIASNRCEIFEYGVQGINGSAWLTYLGLVEKINSLVEVKETNNEDSY